MAYRAWAGDLPEHIEVSAAQLPGRGPRLREPAFTRLAPLVAALHAHLPPLTGQRLALFGHSLGALVAFELARSLDAAGGPTVEHLFVSSCRAPQLPGGRAPVHTLPDAALRDHLRALGGTPPEVLAHAELMALLLPAVRADYAVYETYTHTPGPPLTCPLTALGGAQDANAGGEALLGWEAHTTGRFHLRLWPGGHFYLHTDPAPVLATLAAALPPA